jgi:hypothetical protein
MKQLQSENQSLKDTLDQTEKESHRLMSTKEIENNEELSRLRSEIATL